MSSLGRTSTLRYHKFTVSGSPFMSADIRVHEPSRLTTNRASIMPTPEMLYKQLAERDMVLS